MKRKLNLIAISTAIVLSAEFVHAQGPGHPPKMQDRGGQMRQQTVDDNRDPTATALQNLPNTTVLAQRMLANYDADANGELSQSELQMALEGLRQLIAQNIQASQMTAATQQDQRTAQSRMQNQANASGDRRSTVGGQRGRRGR